MFCRIDSAAEAACKPYASDAFGGEMFVTEVSHEHGCIYATVEEMFIEGTSFETGREFEVEMRASDLTVLSVEW